MANNDEGSAAGGLTQIRLCQHHCDAHERHAVCVTNSTHPKVSAAILVWVW